MSDERKTAGEVRQLANKNYTEKEINVKISYDICLSKADTSLLIINK